MDKVCKYNRHKSSQIRRELSETLPWTNYPYIHNPWRMLYRHSSHSDSSPPELKTPWTESRSHEVGSWKLPTRLESRIVHLQTSSPAYKTNITSNEKASHIIRNLSPNHTWPVQATLTKPHCDRQQHLKHRTPLQGDRQTRWIREGRKLGGMPREESY